MAIYFINFSIGLFNALFSVHAFIKNQMYLISIRNAISTAIYAGCVLGLFWAFEAGVKRICLSARSRQAAASGMCMCASIRSRTSM